MALFKALFPGLILTFIIAIVLGSNGSDGGFLHISRTHISGHIVYWSWPLFIASTGIAWGIIAMMD
jgi:hypothetical protein